MRWLSELWRSQSLRAHITLVATGLFSIAVLTGAVLLITLQRQALIRALDSSASKAGTDVAGLVVNGKLPANIIANSGGVDQIQVVDAQDRVISHSPGTDALKSLLYPDQLARARAGHHVTITPDQANTDEQMRVTGIKVGNQTVVVATGLARVEESVRILRSAALLGSPIAVLAMGLATYFIVGRTLRSVAGLRQGAEEITAAGLSDQRLPVSDADDEIHRLALTLNVMLDRIDASTKRQRTFVGDAAHELRSPLASLRLQLEVAERLGPATDWSAVLTDAMVDVDRLDRLVQDLLALARSDEAGGALRRVEPVALDELVATVAAGYPSARVPVHTTLTPVLIDGDPDALHRVVVNLIDNAQRYAASAVEVSLTPGTGPQPTAVLVIADDGPGIPAGERERVFDRFYRLNASRSRESGGTGLGLPIVRDLVRAHGGSVRLSGNDPGVRVTITLPVASVS